MFTLTSLEIVKSVMLKLDGEEQAFTFRVDIVRTAQGFSAELYEQIYYRLRPSFDPPEPDWEADEAVWVSCNHLLRDEGPHETAEACMQAVLQSLDHPFGFLNRPSENVQTASQK